MKLFFAAFNTEMNTDELGRRRKALSEQLGCHGIEFQNIPRSAKVDSMVARIDSQARGQVVVAIDDARGVPEKAEWFRELTRRASHLSPSSRPSLIYVSKAHSAAALLSAHLSVLCREYVKRDDKGAWVAPVVEAALELKREMAEASEPPEADRQTGVLSIVGTSECFCDAVIDLVDIIAGPVGLVTGEVGVGKMNLIRTLWRQIAGRRRMIVLPCGTFFKDYYMGSTHRRFGGGRDGIDQINRYLEEADRDLLVLHHVDRLPRSLQEDLAVRLEGAPCSEDGSSLLLGVDSGGLAGYDVKVIATSTYPPSTLKQNGRVIPDLLGRLRKHHVHIPSLRERGRRDMELLCTSILRRIARREGKPPRKLSDEALAMLCGQSRWPENIAGLIQTLEAARRKCRARKTIRPSHLPALIGDVEAGQTLDAAIKDAKCKAIAAALDETGSVAAAAKQLGRSEKGLYRLIRDLKIG